jgi:hypothetical protein
MAAVLAVLLLLFSLAPVDAAAALTMSHGS